MTDGALSLDERCGRLADARGRLTRVLVEAVAAENRGERGLSVDRLLAVTRGLASLVQDHWDRDPGLVEVASARALDTDVATWIRLLAQIGGSGRGSLVSLVLEHVPENVTRHARLAISETTAVEILRAWHEAHGDIWSLDALDDELRSARRWRRIRAATHLQRSGGPNLLDDTGDEIDVEALARWVQR